MFCLGVLFGCVVDCVVLLWFVLCVFVCLLIVHCVFMCGLFVLLVLFGYGVLFCVCCLLLVCVCCV